MKTVLGIVAQAWDTPAYQMTPSKALLILTSLSVIYWGGLVVQAVVQAVVAGVWEALRDGR